LITRRKWGKSERGQVSATAAKIYEEFYLPGLFAEWAPRVIDAAQIHRGQRVVDVACDTGVLAQAVADRVGTEGMTVGIDINEGMLNIAREEAPDFSLIFSTLGIEHEQQQKY
jgi:ubiquinone/menaquinone biosynthesis C-methylase UbiE